MRIQTEMTLHENQNDIDEETVIRIQKSHGQQKADKMKSQNDEKKLKQFIAQREKIFHVFDKVQTMLYTSLVTAKPFEYRVPSLSAIMQKITSVFTQTLHRACTSLRNFL